MTIEINRSNNQDIDGLLWGWAWGDGGPESLTFSFPTSTAEYTGYAAINGFSSFNAAQQTAVRNVLTEIASFCNLTFTETTSPGADLRYAEATSTQVGTGVFPVTTAYAFPPQPGIPTDVQGDNWFNTVYYNNPVLGLYAYMTVMHETGHSLGLKHGHETQTSHGVTFPTLPADHDSFEYSIMTYRAFPGSPTDYDHAVDHPTTYMQDDIAALQYLYGANYSASAHNGDTVYTWSPTTGEAFIDGIGQGVPWQNFVLMTIWDGGGNDTYDFSNYTTDLKVDLYPGLWTVLDTSAAQAQRANLGNDGAGGPTYFARGNIANALTDPNNPSETLSLIENAVGGTGDDFILGNGIGNILWGIEGNDRLDGRSGADAMFGGDGNDVYVVDNPGDVVGESSGVGSGYDTVLSSVNYTLLFGFESLILTGGATDGTGNGLSNFIAGNDASNSLYGLAGNDMLNGYLGNDSLDGGSGADTMDGGDGNDLYTVDDASDVVVEFVLGGFDFVQSFVSYTLSSEVEQLFLLDSLDSENAVTGTGNELNNILYGNISDNVLFGLAGHDNLVGGYGNDELDGGAGNDAFDGGYGDDTLYGGDGNDDLGGWEGDDTLDGGAGADHMDGDYGNDVYKVDDVGDVAEETFILNALAGGIDTVQSSVTHTLGFGIENLTLVGTVSSNGTGNGNDNFILGNSGSNVLEGLAGDDLLNGGVGLDTTSYRFAEDGVTVNLGLTTAQNTVGAGIDTLANLENLTGSEFNDTLTGSSTNNVLEGLAGDDSLDGGAGTDTASYGSAAAGVTVNLGLAGAQNTVGAGIDTMSNFENLTGSNFNDTLTGNTGNNLIEGLLGDDVMDGAVGTDTVSYESATAGVTVNLATTTAQNTLGAGIDTLLNFENLRGSNFNDTLTGDAKSNILIGGLGNDILNGAGATDTVSYETATAGVTVSLLLAGAQNTVNAGTDTLSNFENIRGSSFNDTLTGNGGTNILTGGAGDDVLNGDAGSDTASYETTASGVTVSLALAGAQNTIGAGTDTLSNFENLRGSNFNDTLTGNAASNVIIGHLGDDLLDGGAGTDTASYETATTGVTVSLAIAGAQNTIGAGTDTLLNFEHLRGGVANDTLTGNGGSNIITGGLGNDVLDGGAGTDTASYDTAFGGVTVNLGLAGAQNTVNAGIDILSNFENLKGSIHNDTLTGNAASNVIIGDQGNDIMNGDAGIDIASYETAKVGVTVSLAIAGAQNTVGAGTDTLSNFENLRGGNFNDTLTGDAGANQLTGGLGNDTMTGNSGADSFVFNTALNAATNNDVITDFSPVDDTLVLENAIFTQFAATGAIPAGTFVANAGGVAGDANDFLLYDTNTGKLFYDADGNGAGAKIEFVTLVGIPTITTADFAIV